MKVHLYKKSEGFAAVLVIGIVLVVLALGGVGLAAVQNAKARGTHTVTATVRVADGVSEDEMFMGPMAVTRNVSARSLVFNQTEYVLTTAKISDIASVTFEDCTLAGTYQPVKCTATSGTAYWITLTEIGNK